MMTIPRTFTSFPYTTLFRSIWNVLDIGHRPGTGGHIHGCDVDADPVPRFELVRGRENLYPVLDHFAWLHRSDCILRSEEHTSELQSPDQLVCRLLLEKKNTK